MKRREGHDRRGTDKSKGENDMSSKTMVIGIAGGTGSGKTTVTQKIKEYFGEEVSVIYHDNYYKQHDELTYEERTKLNYDHPDTFDTAMMAEHLRRLRAGEAGCP